MVVSRFTTIRYPIGVHLPICPKLSYKVSRMWWFGSHLKL